MIGVTSVILNQIAVFVHFTIVFTAFVHSRPYGNYGFYAQLFQLFNHSIGIGPISGFKFEFTLHGPMEEVYYDSIHGKTSSLMFSCHCKNFILITITQLTLPITQTVFRHHRASACCSRILFNNLSRCISCCNKVVHLLGGLSDPLCLIGTEGYRTDSRIVPEETVSSAGYHKGNTGLRVSVCQL